MSSLPHCLNKRRPSLGIALAAAAAALLACPAAHSPPCTADADCEPGQRCRRGACAAQCRDELDCAQGQVCESGRCGPPPQCRAAADCASGFTCAGGQCACLRDSACAADQACLQGACRPRPTCAQDAECAPLGRVCEPNQGLCLLPCSYPEDCAPGADPALAQLLYRCQQGRCLRRCTGALACGGGLVCEGGECVRSNCQTFADCPPGQYCTQAVGGVCRAYQACQAASGCPPNHECRPFAPGACPPGFDCAQAICHELPRCLVDGECPPPAYCGDRHCQPTVTCGATAPCPAGQACIGGQCVPSPCRGHPDCPAGQSCVDGRCEAPPPASQVVALRLLPAAGVLEVGDSLRLTLIAVRADGSTAPLPSASYSVEPAAAAEVTAEGLLTARAPGGAVVRAALAGSPAGPGEAAFQLYAPAAAGERVVRVIDAATRQPLAGVLVAACADPPPDGPCPAPVERSTGAGGEARFMLAGALASFGAASLDLRSDGLPRYDRASVLATAASDVLLPLGHNPVHGAAGYTATVSFAGTHGDGELLLGLSAASRWDVLDQDPRTLFGDLFWVTLPLSGQRAPFLGASVVALNAGLPVPLPVKGAAYALADPGPRAAVGFGGKVPLSALGAGGSADLLSYVGALDYGVLAPRSFAAAPWVADAADLDGDGRCADPARCPAGPEDLPDYGAFPALAFAPLREQALRTEVALAALPAGLGQVVTAAVQVRGDVGPLALGLSSRAGATAGTVLLRSGAPYAAAEGGEPGIWAFATSAAAPRRTTGRLVRFPLLPALVEVGPWLPLPAGASYSAAERRLLFGQPAWSAVAAAGAELGRATLTSGTGRHVVYFEVQGGALSARLPDGPSAAAAADPAAQAGAALELTAVDLAAGTTAVGAVDLRGPNLGDLPLLVDRYARE